jgi:selenocysteine-specific elongation factor
MQVIATAGHVDHGKSTLVRALTGMEPDRWAEERRRGLTIDLGFAWMKLPGGGRLAFVDVPGHERFVPNMLAGVGPVPAVLFVVAADGGWMPQSAEHLAAIDAVGIRRGLLAVTRSDLADPGPATRQALDMIAATSLGTVEAVAVSAVTGAGLPELRAALVALVASLPAPDPEAPVRLWVDRSFSIRGSGTVITGTLPAGTVRTGQELLLTPAMRPARIRGIESLNEPVPAVRGVARVALNLRGVPADVPARGMALVDAGRWTMTRLADVRLSGQGHVRLPPDVTLHIGSARTLARIRPLGPETPDLPGTIARLTLRDPLPLHVGDRVLLRDPGSAGVVIVGATVLDVAPPALARRGAAAAAGRELAAWPDRPAADDLLRRHGLLRASALAAMGLACAQPPVAAGWIADPARWRDLRRQLAEAVAAHARRDPLAIGMPPEAARAALGLPDRSLVEALAQAPPVQLSGGYLVVGKTREPQPALPAHLMAGVKAVLADLAGAPFMAPDAGRLRELGLDPRAIGAAARAGLLLRVTEQIVLAPGAAAEAARALARLPQPFTAAEARQALGTTRRVAIPLLEYLDRAGVTQRLPDDRRRLRLAQRLRNSGERRMASATRRAVLTVFARRRKTKPPPCTRKTDAPGVSAIEMFAYRSGLRRTVTRPSPLCSTWYPLPSLRLSTMTSSPGVTFLRGTLTFGMTQG